MGDEDAQGIKVQLPVRRHFVQQGGFQYADPSAGLQVKEDPALLPAVFQQHISRRKVGGIEVVQQHPPLRIDGFHVQFFSPESPFPYESEGAHLSLRLLECDNVLSPSAKKGSHGTSVITDEAGQGAYIDIAAGVLPNSLCLHLGQTVGCGEAPVADTAFHGRPCRHSREGDKEQSRQQVS